MQIVKRGVEFTGYVMLRHKECGYSRRINVGKYFFNGFAPDGKALRETVDYDGCEWKGDRFGKFLHHRCGCNKANFNIEVHGKMIFGRYVDDVICNGKCMGAVGHSCECQCGGQNHGGKWGG